MFVEVLAHFNRYRNVFTKETKKKEEEEKTNTKKYLRKVFEINDNKKRPRHDFITLRMMFWLLG